MRMGYKLVEKVRSDGGITEDEVRDALGRTTSSAAIDLLGLISKHKTGSAMKMMDELMAEGKDVSELLRECLTVISDIIRIRLKRGGIGPRGEDDIKKMTIINDDLNGKQMEGLYEVFRQSIIDLSTAAIPRDIVAMMAVVSAIRMHEEGDANRH